MTYVELIDRGFMFIVPVNKEFLTSSGKKVHADYISMYVSLTGEEDGSLEIAYDPTQAEAMADDATIQDAKKFLVEMGCDEVVVGHIRMTELQDPEPEFDEDTPWYRSDAGEPLVLICHASDFAAWLRADVSKTLLSTRNTKAG